MAFSVKDLFNIFCDKKDREEGGDLPDLARVIEPESVLKLVRIYGGQQFHIPKWEVVETIMRNVCIWLAIRGGVPAPRMEAQFKVSRQRAHQIHNAVEEAVQNYKAALERGDTSKRVFSDDPEKDFADLMQWLEGADVGDVPVTTA